MKQKYAKKKQIQIVPEIDMPGHMKGFATLYRKKYGRKAAIKIFGDDQDALQIRTGKALAFSKTIYREYADLFSGCKYFHIGCDEFWDGDDASVASYINRTTAYLKKKGFEVWMWNDLITHENLQQLDHDSTVTYWSWDGENGAPASNRKNIIGAAVSVWNEDSGGVSARRIYGNVRRLFKVLVKK